MVVEFKAEVTKLKAKLKKAEDAFEEHMNKAAAEFERKVFPKLKQAVVSKGKKKQSQAKKPVSKTAKTKRSRSSKKR